MKQYIHTFEHAQFGHALRAQSFAHNELAGIVRCAHAAGLKARRNKSGSWHFWLPKFGFSPASDYLLR